MTPKFAMAGAAALVLLIATPAAAQQAPEPNGAPITLDQARRIIAAGEAEARRLHFAMAFAVVEPSGDLVAFEKIDGTQYGSIDVAQAKARTAARFRRPTKAFFDQLASGRTAVLSTPGVLALEGGIPIIIGGKMVGAVGVSGGTSDQDGQVALAALAAAH